MTLSTSLAGRTAPNIPHILRHCTYLTPDEYEFLADYETITITPLFKADKQIKLRECTVGPFVPQLDIDVPLWFALQLKQLKLCTIRAPKWMDPNVLRQQLQYERTEKSKFGSMPYHYNEIFVVLFDQCINDIDAAYGYKSHKVIRNLILEIQSERKAKILSGINNFSTQTRNSVFKLNNIAALELYEVRSIVVHALNTSVKMQLNDITNKPKVLQIQADTNVRQRALPSTESQTRSSMANSSTGRSQLTGSERQ